MTETISRNTYYQPLHDAVLYLSVTDADGAAIENKIGWNRFDSRIGHQLAAKAYGEWTEQDTFTAYKITRKYLNSQLKPAGIDLTLMRAPLIPEEEDENRLQRVSRRMRLGEPHASIKMDADKSRFIFAWGGDDPNWDDRKLDIQAIGGARFDGKTRTWSAPVNIASIDAVTKLVTRSLRWTTPFSYTEDMPTLLDAKMEEWGEKITASNAATSDLNVEGLKDGMELRPFQRAGVEFAIKSGRCLIADEMGLGKTIEAIATIIATDAFPAVIFCPASLKLNWKREIENWSKIGLNIQIAKGTKNPTIEPTTDVLIVNYDIAKAWSEALSQRFWQAMVLDESHYIKTAASQRTGAIMKLIKTVKPRLRILLSGTPILNRPVELWTQIQALGYDNDFGGYWGYVNRYCDPKKNSFGVDTSGASNLDELNSFLRSSGAMIRRLKKDVLTELPPKQWATVPVEMTATVSKEYRRAERGLAEWIGEQRAESAERQAEWRHAAQDKGLDGGDLLRYIERQRAAYVSTETSKAARSEQLLRFNALKQLAYEGKEKSVFDWIDNFLQDDKKLVVFAWHRHAVDRIAERYGAPKIQGGMTQEDVEEGKRRFMEDPECRVIVCNIAAGGVGHTLTAASDVAFAEFAWNPALMDQASDRVHRIGQTDSVTAWQLVAVHPDGEDTIDGEIAKIIATKREVVDAATDGLGADAQISMIKELTRRIMGEKE